MESYTVLGADGGEYGPANLDQLLVWKREGRIAGDTQVRVQSTGTVIEASNVIGTVGSRVPPVIPQPVPQPRQASSVPGWAWAVVIGAVALTCVVFPASILFPAVASARSASMAPVVMREVQDVATALLLVGSEPTKLPDLSKRDMVKERLSVRLGGSSLDKATSYGFNTALSGTNPSTLANASEVWMFRTMDDLGGGNHPVCFADGQCTAMTNQEFNQIESVAPVQAEPEPSKPDGSSGSATL